MSDPEARAKRRTDAQIRALTWMKPNQWVPSRQVARSRQVLVPLCRLGLVILQRQCRLSRDERWQITGRGIMVRWAILKSRVVA